MSNNTNIVVIGAGTAGIACATKLLEMGFHNVVVLESENHIGGRIHTIPFANNVIDLGAQWCHGEKDNIVYELAKKYDLLESTGDIYEAYQCIRSNGDIVADDVAQRLKDIVNNSLITRQIELRDFNGSLGSYLENKFYNELNKPENIDIDMIIAREFFDTYKKFENSVEASDNLEDVSGSGYLEYWECDGDILLNWKDLGFIELLKILMKSKEMDKNYGILEKRIMLGKTVTQIQWNRDDFCTEIRCTDGTTLNADHVIVTVSLGVLKEQQGRLFQPKLPIEKQRAINGLAFGTVDKIFIEFPEQFWPNDWTGFTLLWREEDLNDIRGTSKAWLEDVFGFYRVNYQPNMLSGWVIGASARHMETLPEDEVQSGCMYLLKRFLPFHVPDPINFKTSKWFVNRNFRGSYSFRSMHTERIGTSARELMQPLTVVAPTTSLVPNSSKSNEFNQSRCDKPVVLFAGEATSPHYYSTVHGAVESGWREALRLADFYGILNNNSTVFRKSQL